MKYRVTAINLQGTEVPITVIAESESEAIAKCKASGNRPISVTKISSPLLWVIPLALMAIVSIAFVYYTHATKSISGQVFIITKGRVNIELGGVSIRYLDSVSMKKHVDACFKDHKGRIDDLKEKFGARGAFDDTDVQLEYRELEKVILPMELRHVVMKSFYDSVANPGNDLEILNDEFIEKLSKVVLPKNIFSLCSEIGKTDSNGRFTVNVPRFASGWILAQGERNVLTETETYYWVEAIGNNAMQLSNDSLWK